MFPIRFTFISLFSLIAVAAAAQELSFNRDIRPILSDKCFFCHGPDPAHREADLRLDLEDDAKEIAIVPGDASESELVARITSDDPDLLMPPADSGKKLTAQQIASLGQWISEGAPTNRIGLTRIRSRMPYPMWNCRHGRAIRSIDSSSRQ